MTVEHTLKSFDKKQKIAERVPHTLLIAASQLVLFDLP
jgi:hypothetical protein